MILLEIIIFLAALIVIASLLVMLIAVIKAAWETFSKNE